MQQLFDGAMQLLILAGDDDCRVIGHAYIGLELAVFEEGAFGGAVSDYGDAVYTFQIKFSLILHQTLLL